MSLSQRPKPSQPVIIQSDNFLDALTGALGQGKTLLITSSSFIRRGLIKRIIEQCHCNEFLIYDRVTPNPELNDLLNLFKQIQFESIVQIVAIGGGSVIDSAKVLACLLANPDAELIALLEGRIRGLRSSLPVIAIPTTSGTGAEVTPFATVWDSVKQKKISLSKVTPKVAILDANLTLSLPQRETLYPALDALSHALESLWNINRTEQSQAYAIRAIEKICDGLPRVLEQPQDLDARATLQQAAMLAGLAISQTRTAVAHAISYPLTLKYGLPHGLACSFTLAAIVKEVGHKKLNIPKALADRVTTILDQCCLAKEIEYFVDWETLIKQLDVEPDKARAGNFLLPVDANLVRRVVEASKS